MKHGAAAHSIHLQNMLLYVWGVLFNSLTLLGADGVRLFSRGLLAGYRPVVWALVLNNAFNGLAISAILKYGDNIVRVFAHAAAMLLTMIIEVCLFGGAPTPKLFVSATVVACAVYLYNRPEASARMAAQDELRAMAHQPRRQAPPLPPLAAPGGPDQPAFGVAGDACGAEGGFEHPSARWPSPQRHKGCASNGMARGITEADLDERQPLVGRDDAGGDVHSDGLDGPRLVRHADGYRVTYGSAYRKESE